VYCTARQVRAYLANPSHSMGLWGALLERDFSHKVRVPPAGRPQRQYRLRLASAPPPAHRCFQECIFAAYAFRPATPRCQRGGFSFGVVPPTHCPRPRLTYNSSQQHSRLEGDGVCGQPPSANGCCSTHRAAFVVLASSLRPRIYAPFLFASSLPSLSLFSDFCLPLNVTLCISIRCPCLLWLSRSRSVAL
jgi:hypothetical protein